MSETGPFRSLTPTEILYYYEEPLVFLAEDSNMPLLCLKVDEERDEWQFLAVIASRDIARRLSAGTLSLRSAFLQPWCWIIRTRPDYSVIRTEGLSREQVPHELLPEAGVGLYPHHGHIVDEFSHLTEPSGFLTVAFKGGQLGVGRIPFGVFKSLVDGVYISVRKIFSPVVEAISSEKLAESVIGRILSVPVYQPVFASLSITIDQPTIDLSSVKKQLYLQSELASEKFNDAAEEFVDSAIEIERLAREDKLSDSFAYGASLALEIMAEIAPTENAPFDTLSISGSVRATPLKQVVFDSVKRGGWANLNSPISGVPA